MDAAGNLYGVCYQGGSYGSVYKLANGVLTDLYDFTGGKDGCMPVGPIALDSAGTETYMERRLHAVPAALVTGPSGKSLLRPWRTRRWKSPAMIAIALIDRYASLGREALRLNPAAVSCYDFLIATSFR